MAARFKAIILNTVDGGVSVALWADVPTARQPFYASAGATSAWLSAQAGDNSAIASGAVAEKVMTLRLAPTETAATVRAQAQAEAAAWQSYVNSFNPWARYGSTWDGSAWVPNTIA